jgi:hypothetical protein
MYIHVEPKDGSEIDRLTTALLNATGVVKNVIEATPVSAVAYAALLIAQDLGIADCFFPGDDDSAALWPH